MVFYGVPASAICNSILSLVYLMPNMVPRLALGPNTGKGTDKLVCSHTS